MGPEIYLLYAFIQGITEFLPISSSGHLAIFEQIFGEQSFSFNVFLHFATLLAVLVYFCKDLVILIRDFFKFDYTNKNFKLALYLIVASIPAAIFGLLTRKIIASSFSSLVFLIFGFFISGLFLFFASYAKKKEENNMRKSFVIGLGQALALFPGISRSGTTTSIGIFQGLSKEEAVRFSFLLSIPIILGASLLEIKEMVFSYELIMPFIFCFFVGIFSIHIFLKKLKVRNFRYFAYYCWFVAICLGLYLIF